MAISAEKARMIIYLTSAQRAALEAESKRLGTGMSALVRSIIAEWSEQHQNKAEA